ncbi:glycosyltransferase family 4 protein [Labilibacter sediminis]|nr:glycosyltransferase family 4 protein [Labilibacter sediminis]
MKIVVTGTRGIPNILGGVETHCQELYPRIVNLGHEIILIRRKAYVEESPVRSVYKGVKLKDIWTPKQKSLEAIIHTFLAVIYAKKVKADLLHVHAIGPAIMIPFARLLGLKVVMTHHGPDYDRQKWNRLAKSILKLGEYLGIRFANKVIVISKVIDEIVKSRYQKAKTALIYNGVNIEMVPQNNSLLEYYSLKSDEYIVAVGRFVPEKGFHDLIEAYAGMNIDAKLVIVGDADHESEYSKKLKLQAAESNTTLTGFKSGDELRTIFGNAKLFVLPSYHEGLPIALLEALSFGLNVLVSDIPANKMVNLESSEYFKVGDCKNLREKIKEKLKGETFKDYSNLIKEKYNWGSIAKETLVLYEKINNTY